MQKLANRALAIAAPLHHLLGTLYQTMPVNPKVVVNFLSKLKTHYFYIAFHNHIICYLYYLIYILLCTAPLSYRWGRHSKSRWYGDMIWVFYSGWTYNCPQWDEVLSPHRLTHSSQVRCS